MYDQSLIDLKKGDIFLHHVDGAILIADKFFNQTGIEHETAKAAYESESTRVRIIETKKGGACDLGQYSSFSVNSFTDKENHPLLFGRIASLRKQFSLKTISHENYINSMLRINHEVVDLLEKS